MQTNLDGVIRSHEKTFVGSYRSHMLNVTKDLVKYKKALNEKEFVHRRNDKIMKLQTNMDWFKSEALELSKVNFKLKE